MLAPRCDNCGGLLESLPRGLASAVAADRGQVNALQVSPAFGRMVRVTLVALLLFAAARFGWGAGGPSLALTAAGVIGMFTVPLIVE